MSNLKRINPETFGLNADDFVLEGIFEKINPPQNTFIDEENVLATIEKYKTDFVETGDALGELNDGFLVMPVTIEYDGKSVEAEQVTEEEKDPAFMILNIWWNRDIKSICGAVVILDTDDGLKIKKAIGQGIDCYMSASQTEIYSIMDKDSGRMLSRISNINGYKISIFDFHNKPA